MFVRSRIVKAARSQRGQLAALDLSNVPAVKQVQTKLRDVELALTITTAASVTCALGVILLLTRSRR